MGRSLIETLMGALVLAVAGLFAVFAYNSTSVRAVAGYEVTAKFERVDGLTRGADVRLSGIRIGTVIDQRLEAETFLAVVRMTIDSSIRLPTDTVAQITSEGLLGGNFLALVPGGDDKTIPPGGQIKYTQPPVNLVQLLGKFMFNPGERPVETNSGTKPK